MQAFYQAELRPDLVGAHLGRFEASLAARGAILAVCRRFATAMFLAVKIQRVARRLPVMPSRKEAGSGPVAEVSGMASVTVNSS